MGPVAGSETGQASLDIAFGKHALRPGRLDRSAGESRPELGTGP